MEHYIVLPTLNNSYECRHKHRELLESCNVRYNTIPNYIGVGMLWAIECDEEQMTYLKLAGAVFIC